MRHSLKGQERERSTKYSLLKIAIPQLLTLTQILPLALSIRFSLSAGFRMIILKQRSKKQKGRHKSIQKL